MSRPVRPSRFGGPLVSVRVRGRVLHVPILAHRVGTA